MMAINCKRTLSCISLFEYFLLVSPPLNRVPIPKIRTNPTANNKIIDKIFTIIPDIIKKWSKSKDLPENTGDKLDLCMLIDHGYSLKNQVATWSIQGGELQLTKEETWQMTKIKVPVTPAKSTWRCDVKYPKNDG